MGSNCKVIDLEPAEDIENPTNFLFEETWLIFRILGFFGTCPFKKYTNTFGNTLLAPMKLLTYVVIWQAWNVFVIGVYGIGTVGFCHSSTKNVTTIDCMNAFLEIGIRSNTDRVIYTFLMIYTFVSHHVMVWCNFTLAKGLVKHQEMAGSMVFTQKFNIDKKNCNEGDSVILQKVLYF
jgi:hypothetical protein